MYANVSEYSEEPEKVLTEREEIIRYYKNKNVRHEAAALLQTENGSGGLG